MLFTCLLYTKYNFNKILYKIYNTKLLAIAIVLKN